MEANAEPLVWVCVNDRKWRNAPTMAWMEELKNAVRHFDPELCRQRIDAEHERRIWLETRK